MTKFYCIVSDINNLANPDTYHLLEKAANERGVEFVTLDAKTLRPREVLVEDDAIIYRLGLSRQAVLLEAFLVRPSHATFYAEPQELFGRAFAWGSTMRLQRAGLPIIPTDFTPWLLSKEDLDGVVNQLGGYPIVIKGSGGSHGSAVRKAESLDELYGVLQNDPQRETLVLRRFVHEARHIRIVVVGGKAADAIEYEVQPDDFRTNAVAVPQVKAFNLEDNLDIASTAERAVQAIGLEFGGVDILLQPDGQFFIAEVNFPCNFARNQLNTGADIAGAMVDYLVQKLS